MEKQYPTHTQSSTITLPKYKLYPNFPKVKFLDRK